MLLPLLQSLLSPNLETVVNVIIIVYSFPHF